MMKEKKQLWSEKYKIKSLTTAAVDTNKSFIDWSDEGIEGIDKIHFILIVHSVDEDGEDNITTIPVTSMDLAEGYLDTEELFTGDKLQKMLELYTGATRVVINGSEVAAIETK